jgi:hypothetical protein
MAFNGDRPMAEYQISSFREMFVYALPVGMLEKSGHSLKRFCALILEIFA